MRVWTLFEALEAKRLQASIGFIDPLILNDVQLRQDKEFVTDFIAKAWVAQKDKDMILFAYNPPYVLYYFVHFLFYALSYVFISHMWL